ncbi:hypothetical protein CDAR_120221 [Caerostris darwini]|uniref:Uncharacterized protein n=1 Tax=Caerostris darwini TaxID=1538125 RepID=A0AAV4UPM6_9ARAC|nr:hypothetical protein CDAR_120221 [Caerostris darwini]
MIGNCFRFCIETICNVRISLCCHGNEKESQSLCAISQAEILLHHASMAITIFRKAILFTLHPPLQSFRSQVILQSLPDSTTPHPRKQPPSLVLRPPRLSRPEQTRKLLPFWENENIHNRNPFVARVLRCAKKLPPQSQLTSLSKHQVPRPGDPSTPARRPTPTPVNNPPPLVWRPPRLSRPEQTRKPLPFWENENIHNRNPFVARVLRCAKKLPPRS